MIADIITDFAQRGIALHVEGDGIRVRAPAGTLTDADRAVLRDQIRELVAELQRRFLRDQGDTRFFLDGERWTWLDRMPREFAWPDDPEQVEADENCWSEISQRDLEYLTGPRRWRDPCASCGGQLIHSGACQEQILNTKVPFGKHAGKTVIEAPRDDVLWLLKTRNLPEEVRQAIQLRLSKEKIHGH